MYIHRFKTLSGNLRMQKQVALYPDSLFYIFTLIPIANLVFTFNMFK